MGLSPSSPLPHVLCALSLSHSACPPSTWGPGGWEGRELGQGPGPLDLNGALVSGGPNWDPGWEGQQLDVSMHLGSGLRGVPPGGDLGKLRSLFQGSPSNQEV